MAASISSCGRHRYADSVHWVDFSAPGCRVALGRQALHQPHPASVAMHMDMPGRTRTTGAYWQGDFLLAYKHYLQATRQLLAQNHPLELTLGVGNLFDRAYWGHLDWGNVLRPGRNVYVNAAYVF